MVRKKNIGRIFQEMVFKIDSQSISSDSEEELANSDAHSTSDFQKDLDFGKNKIEIREKLERIFVGIDRQLSAQIERGEIDPTKMIPSGKFSIELYSISNSIFLVDEKSEPNERTKLANLAAEAAERRLSISKTTSNVNPHL